MFDGNFNPQSKNNKEIAQNNSKTTATFGHKMASDTNDKVDFADYLDKDFNSLAGGPSIMQEDIEYKAEALKTEAKNLNTALISYGFPKMGDLFSNKLFDIENTLKWYN